MRPKLYILATFLLPAAVALGQTEHEKAHADHMEHHFDPKESAKSFDDPARDAWQMPDRVIAALNLKRGQAVADIGAGTGYFSVRLAKAEAAPKVYANLAQVMRGILFPSSNVIFYAQSKDPAEVKPAADPTMATDPLENSYGGWAAVENSSLALAEAANLLTIPGRLCSNGRPVPVNSPEWAKFVQALRDAGMTAYKSAQAKNQDKVLDASDAVTQACYNCHNRYREKAGGIADRCM